MTGMGQPNSEQCKRRQTCMRVRLSVWIGTTNNKINLCRGIAHHVDLREETGKRERGARPGVDTLAGCPGEACT